ncbi:hypothetical protein CBS101457_006202 [Exobasidium rhododendri]|nr:hypothetical protein CBS101457_006202 [Exobasidium rhododendri]
MTSSYQAPACIFTPTIASELSSAMKIIGKNKTPFAVSSGQHASNQGFSSTKGIQISMKGFQQVTLSSDKSYLDVGSGNVWDNVYQSLEGTGRMVVGGRVTGVGVGGFITGGGGYSWKTNQYGLTTDTLIHADMVLPNGNLVTASSTSYSDLFFAIKGGGNQFGIIYNFRLATHTQGAMVYGGLRTYTGDQLPVIIKAVNDFSANNTDPKAQIIPTFNTLFDLPQISLLGFYDGTDPGESLSVFDNIPTFTDGWKQMSYLDLIQSSPSNITGGTRGLFHTVSLQNYSEPLLQQIANQSNFYGTQFLRSATFISYDVEPFLSNYGKFANANGGSAWPHATSPLPLNIYFAWLDPLDDDYYRTAALQSASLLSQLAKQEGQDLSTFTLYPNYAMAGTTANQLYGAQNSAALRAAKAKYDPNNVMALTTFFSFT